VFTKSRALPGWFVLVDRAAEASTVEGKHLSADGSFVEGNASKESRISREQLAEAAQVHQTVRQYVQELEQQNPLEEPVLEQEQVSAEACAFASPFWCR
jgi:hypothetical protein